MLPWLSQVNLFLIKESKQDSTAKDSLNYWEKLDDFVKSMWSWPTPGDKLKIDNHKPILFTLN